MLSVIVAIYNVESYVEKTIQSIIDQTYRDLEIILVDDGSTDMSGHICDQYAMLDERVIVIHKKNGGLSDARNSGIAVAKGEYIAFVDGDDYIHKQMYEILVSNFRQYHADISIASFQTVGEQERIEDQRIEKQIITIYDRDKAYHSLSDLNITVAWNKVYRKNIFDEIKYPFGLIHEDEFVIHHVIGHCDKIVLSDAKLYYYVSRKGSIMTNMPLKRIYDTRAVLYDRTSYFYQIKEYDLWRIASDDLIDTIIMCAFRAKSMNVNNLNEIVRIVKDEIRQLILDDKIVVSKRMKLIIRCFMINPTLCYFVKNSIHFWGRATDKAHRILGTKSNI